MINCHRKFKCLFIGNDISTFTVFFEKDYELKKEIPYFKRCPKCSKLICYFCSYYSNENDDIFCCLKRKISKYSNSASTSAKKILMKIFGALFHF